jgi:hypothetical protein
MTLGRIGTITLGAVLAVTLTSCGQDEEAASQAISDSIVESNDQTFEVTRKEADCVGDGMVEEIGVEKLTEYKVITEDLKAGDGISEVEMSQEDAGSAADVMTGCADIKGLFTEAMGELPEEARQCVEENLSDEVLHDFLTAIFMNEQDKGNEQLMGALGECVNAGG